MKIVLDANIIIACLLGSRGKLTIITSQNHKLYAPKTIINEIRKYKAKICSKAEYESENFDRNLEALLFFINIVEAEEYNKYLGKAEEAIKERDIKDTDIKDTDYIACALAVNADFIWSDDKDFSSQNLVAIKNTEEFIEGNR